jgi:hypothetical protein
MLSEGLACNAILVLATFTSVLEYKAGTLAQYVRKRSTISRTAICGVHSVTIILFITICILPETVYLSSPTYSLRLMSQVLLLRTMKQPEPGFEAYLIILTVVWFVFFLVTVPTVQTRQLLKPRNQKQEEAERAHVISECEEKMVVHIDKRLAELDVQT